MYGINLLARRQYSLALFFCLLICGIFCASPAHAKAQTYTVTAPPYSATGNGTTDDTAAVTAAITAANNQPGSTVLFPAGTYLISGALSPVGITLMGQSGATINLSTSTAYIKMVGNGVAVKNLNLTGNGTNLGVEPYSGANNWVISGNTFSGFEYAVYFKYPGTGKIESNTFNVVYSYYGVYDYYGGGKATIANNTFTAATSDSGYGIYLYYYPGVLNITGNTFTNLYYGIYAYYDYYGQGVVNAQSNNFTSCYCAIYSYFFGLVKFISNTVNSCEYGYYDEYNISAVISNNSIDSAYEAIYAYYCYGGEDITGNTVTNSSYIGIYDYYDDAMKITKNTITGGGNSTTGIYDYESSNVLISANTLDSQEYGVYSSYSTSVVIKGNTISNEASSGIYTYEDIGTLTISNNSITNVDLGGSASAVIDVEAGSYAAASPIVISKNTYSETTPSSLSYFIYESSGTATVSGNKTTTMLPDYPAQT